jgi:hypothetical protein
VTPVRQWDDWDDDYDTGVRHLMGAAEASRRYGIPAATLRSWYRRGQLHAYGLDERDRPMFDREHVKRLAEEWSPRPTVDRAS